MKKMGLTHSVYSKVLTSGKCLICSAISLILKSKKNLDCCMLAVQSLISIIKFDNIFKDVFREVGNILLLFFTSFNFCSYRRIYQYNEDDFLFLFWCLPNLQTVWIHINMDTKRSCQSTTALLFTCKLVKKSKLKLKSRLHCININADHFI